MECVCILCSKFSKQKYKYILMERSLTVHGENFGGEKNWQILSYRIVQNGGGGKLWRIW